MSVGDYKLTIVASKLDDGKVQVELYSDKMSRNEISKSKLQNPHPFAYLVEPTSSTFYEAIKDGQYAGVFNDSEVLQSILKALRNEKSLRQSAGAGDWRRHQAALIGALDLLWE